MRLKYIDVLKSFAIIAVVLYHSGFLTYGYLGVDIFLVINGYLITKGLYKKFFNVADVGVGGYFEFELGRMVRLLPLLLIAGIVCMMTAFFVMLPDDYENLSESVVATNLFGNNILSAITTKNYWDVVNEYKPLMHTWYVGILMQFYLVYPFLFLLAKLDKKHAQRTLLTLISFLAIVSLLVYIGTENVAVRFYYLPSRFFEFAAGGIVALAWNPQVTTRPFRTWFVYTCYAFLLALMLLNAEIIPANIKLIVVVGLSVVLVMSGETLENRFTGNTILSRIGAASYSIFVWHQVLLAFYRYTWSNHFTFATYCFFIVSVGGLSWLTYQFIEQKTSRWLEGKRGKVMFYTINVFVWLGLNAFAGYIFFNAGVVRDIPELCISKSEVHRGQHKEYNDKIFKLDRPFETEKRHWLVVGNSFGRDFANVILESDVSDSVEVSYIYMEDYKEPRYAERFASADKVFLSSLGTTEETVREFEYVCLTNGFDIDNIVIVGTKNFGESNGQVYVRRNKPDYFNIRVEMEDGYLETNNRLKSFCGERYLDLIGLVIDDNETMPAFTPNHYFVSQDCRHFSKGGAIWFSKLIDWDIYL